MDTHFSFINLILRSYVEDGNGIYLEEHIIHALEIRGGTAGTTGILLDCSMLPKAAALKKKFKLKFVKTREIYDIFWNAFTE